MATLYDLAMQYLNQSLPKTFKYDRTNQPGTPTPVLPVQPTEPIKKLLPVQGGGGGDGFSVYNSDPNRTRNESNYNERPYKSTVYNDAFSMMGDPMANQATGALNADGLMSYAGDKPLEGIPGAAANYLKNSFIGKGLEYLGNKLPVNRTGILQNELLGAGFQLNDIGQIVGDGGAYDTAGNVMSGYNTSRMTEKTFDDRIASLGNMTPEGRAKRTAAILEAKQNFIDAQNKTKTVFDAKSLAKDPDYVSFDDQLTANNMINTEKEDDENFNPLDPLNLNTTTAPGFKNFYNPYERDNIVDVQRTKDAIEEARLRDLDAIDPNPGTVVDNSAPPNNNPNEDHDGDGVPNNVEAAGGSYDGGYQGAEGGFEYTGNFGDPYSDDNFMAGDNSKADPTGTGNFSDAVTGNDTSPGATGGEGGGGTGNNSKIVCTMMNQSYGFGSFRNKIWMKFHKDLSPEYQKGYHKIFLPLVRIAKTNKVVKKILEHIAVHSTIDMRQATRGKMHLLGRIYRKILLPLCYFVGKHG